MKDSRKPYLNKNKTHICIPIFEGEWKTICVKEIRQIVGRSKSGWPQIPGQPYRIVITKFYSIFETVMILPSQYQAICLQSLFQTARDLKKNQP